MTSEARGNFQPDWQRLQDSIDRPVGDPPPAVGRGIVYFYEGKYARAIEHFDEAIKEDPQCIPAISNRGAVHLHNRQYEAALADFNRLIELAPGNCDGHYKRARTYAEMGHREQAMEDFRRALELAPADQAKRRQIEAQIQRLRRTRTTTSAGIVLLVFSVVLALMSTLKATGSTVRLQDAILLLFICAVIAAAGAATVRRWRGWRIWSGSVAWILIAASAYGLRTSLLQFDSVFFGFGRAAFMMFVTALLIAIGSFVLWAKRQEPRPTSNVRTSEVTVAGAMLLLLASTILIVFLFDSGGGFARASDAVIALCIVGFIGWAGAATVFRGWGWRTLSGIVAWLGVIVCVLEPLTRHRPGLPLGYFLASPDLLGAVIIGGPFVFVLWAKRQEPKLEKTSRAGSVSTLSES